MIRLEITDPTTGKTYVPHLSANLSFEMIRENPLFTRRGDYTYDIDISLDDPHNRAIYQHIDRLTANGRPLNRHARLIADGRVIADGTEVVLSILDGMAKIQVLAGNSEMNYLTADSNLLIREMPFGSITTPTNETAAESSMKVFPDANFVFPMSINNMNAQPIVDEHGDTTPADYEIYLREKYLNICDYSTRIHKMEYIEGSTLRPMPFVLFIIEKFIELLGYKVKTNELRSSKRWCRLILIHGYNTLNIAKMLPDWTAAEFVEEMEKFFNCVFLIDPVSKEAVIRSYQNFQDESIPVTLADDKIIDDFEREYEAEGAGFLHDYEGIGYELPDGDYWKKTYLDPSVDKICERATASFEQVGRITGEGMSIEQTNWKIFKLPDKDVEFVRINGYVEDTLVSQALYFYKRYFVNQFKPYGIKDRTTLKTVPVRTEYVFYPTSLSSVRIVPISENLEMMEDVNFEDAIISKVADETVEKMQVCFYVPDAAAIGVNVESNPDRRIPYASVDRNAICVTVEDYLEDSVHGIPVHIPDFLPEYLQDEHLSLELNGEHGLYNTHFASNSIVNVEEANKIRFRDSRSYSPTAKFLIHGRLFVCKQLKYTYANGHQDPIVEGIFYPYI